MITGPVIVVVLMYYECKQTIVREMGGKKYKGLTNTFVRDRPLDFTYVNAESC